MKVARLALFLFLLVLTGAVEAFWSRYALQVHQMITKDALGAPAYTIGSGKYAFKPNAIDIINLSHPKADSGKYDERDHFDSESFAASFNRLVDRRNQLMNDLSQTSPDMLNTDWPLLGYMLHQIQDFYSHSTWIQSGHTDIADFGAATEPSAAGTVPKFILSPSAIGNVCATGGASLLNPVSAEVTTGYYTPGIAFLLVQPPPPPDKCSHGAVVYGALGCTAVGSSSTPDGINHDHKCFASASDVAIYVTASKLAEKETQSFIQALLNDLLATGNRQGACYLMGLDIGAPPCISDCVTQAIQDTSSSDLTYDIGGYTNLQTAPGRGYAFGIESLAISDFTQPCCGFFPFVESFFDVKPPPQAPGTVQAVGDILSPLGTAVEFYPFGPNFPNNFGISSPNAVVVTSVKKVCADASSKTQLDQINGSLNIGLIDLDTTVAPIPTGQATGSFSGYSLRCQNGSSPVAGPPFDVYSFRCH